MLAFKANISNLVGAYIRERILEEIVALLSFIWELICSFCCNSICAYLGEAYGWRYGFGAAGIGMIFGLVAHKWFKKCCHCRIT